MESIFKICKTDAFGIEISANEDQYLLEGAEISFRNYEYLQSVSLNVVHKITYDGNYDLKEVSIIHHVGCDLSRYTFEDDGLYEISHLIIPTKEYIERLNLEQKNEYSILYYYDLEKGKFYKLSDKSEEVNVLEIIEIDSDSTTVVKDSMKIFCLSYLQACLYNINKRLINDINTKCLGKVNYDKETVISRDLILMSVNIINYLLERESYFEALRILESITQCGNLCGKLNIKKENGCGCSKR